MKIAKYQSTKSFFNYPCSHRQWRDAGHCSFVHGYSRSFHFTFECSFLDDRNFVIDFGAFKDFKENILDNKFDHTLLLNEDDPLLPVFLNLEKQGGCKLTILKNVGMEGTANYLFIEMNKFLKKTTDNRVRCIRVEVRENEKNSGIYEEI